MRERAAQILALAEKQGGKVPLRGHGAMSVTLALTGNFAEAVVHADQALALYDPDEHRPLATFGQILVAALCYRSLARVLGYPEAALTGAEQRSVARGTGHATSLIQAIASMPYPAHRRQHAMARAPSDGARRGRRKKGDISGRPLEG